MFEDKFNFSIIYFCIIYIIVICFDVTVDQQSWFPYNGDERDIVIYTFLVIKFACNIDNCKFER